MVSNAERAIYEMVLERDRIMVHERMYAGGSLEAFLAAEPWVCVAPMIDKWPLVDLNVSVTCSGEMERDHVHEHSGGTRGKRPLTTMETLVILCHHHHQDGWATSHRPEIREYIKRANERYGQVRQL